MKTPIFVGWIPNVAGRLSFSHIGNTSNPGRIERINEGDNTGRLVICYQYRFCSDTLLSPWYFKAVYGQVAKVAFVFCARSTATPGDNIGALEGWLYLIDERGPLRAPDAAGPRYDPWSHASEIMARYSTSASEEHPYSRSAVLSTLDQEFRPKSWAAFHVKLFRDGVVELCPDPATREIEPASDTEYPQAGRSYAVEYIANQAFFFLKDISHTHRHHASSSDTITTLSRSPPKENWASDVNYKLHRKIVEMRLSKNPETLFNALGMLAYTNSFSKVATQRVGDRANLKYNLLEIESSIKSSMEAVKWRQTQKNVIKTALPALVIALLKVNNDAEISKAVSLFISNMMKNNIFGWMVCGMFLLQAPFYYGVWRYSDLFGVRRAKRVLASLSQKNQGLFWLTMGLVPAFCVLLYVAIVQQFKARELWIAMGLTSLVWYLILLFFPYLFTLRDLGTLLLSRFGHPQATHRAPPSDNLGDSIISNERGVGQ